VFSLRVRVRARVRPPAIIWREGFPLAFFLSCPQELGEGCLFGSGKITNIKTNFSKLPFGSSTICRRRSNAGSFWKVRR
ncbi:hypothetical protein, partial [Thiolapillus sp.]|uniref:hypothetical protein n=1 Tax=Thiolapillus sp. TaxID=2017437 RepID=UPI003AF8F01E